MENFLASGIFNYSLKYSPWNLIFGASAIESNYRGYIYPRNIVSNGLEKMLYFIAIAISTDTGMSNRSMTKTYNSDEFILKTIDKLTNIYFAVDNSLLGINKETIKNISKNSNKKIQQKKGRLTTKHQNNVNMQWFLVHGG